MVRKKEKHGVHATNSQPVSELLINSLTQIALLDQRIEAAGGNAQREPVSNLYNPDDTADVIDARVINAYEEIITDPTKPRLPGEIIALLQVQQQQMKSVQKT